MPTLDRDVAEKIHILVGDYETEVFWGDKHMCRAYDCVHCDSPFRDEGSIPFPNFGETVRILTKIGEKKGWNQETFSLANGHKTHTLGDHDIHATNMLIDYMNAPTAEEGMKQVSIYLRRIL